MARIADDTVGGVNTFLSQQDGEDVFLLVQFDHEIEVVYEGVRIDEVEALDSETYVPRGSTALLDAIMRGIGLLAERDAEQRVLVVMTDGHENASSEVTRDEVLAEIEKRRGEGWQFVFLGADERSFDEARGLGFAGPKVATYARDKVEMAMNAVSEKVASYSRTGSAEDLRFTSSDRDKLEN
jgi:hypothetical protein